MTNSVCHLVEVVAKNLCAGDLHTAESGADAASSDDVVGVALMKKLADEWREFFSVSACGNLLRLWTQIAGKTLNESPPSPRSAIGAAVNSVCRSCFTGILIFTHSSYFLHRHRYY